MPFIYTADRQKLELEFSPNDIGVTFENPAAAKQAVRATRSVDKPISATAPKGYGRVLLLHEDGAARTAFSTVRSALPTRLAPDVKRTLPVYLEPTSGLRMVTTLDITVRFRVKSTPSQRSKALKDLRLIEREANAFIANQFLVRPDSQIDETTILELANTLALRSDVVEFAFPNFISEHRKGSLPQDPLLPQQWHLINNGSQGAVAGEDVKALPAWGICGGDPSVVIAIVDDGVDLRHPDLQANIWVNPDSHAPDKNGRNFYDNNYDPSPHYFHPPYDRLEGNDIHGTACAGVAAAVSNHKGGVGIAYGCKILPVKIFGADDLAPNDRVADAIRYAGLYAQVISCSWGAPYSADLDAALNDVNQTGRQGKGSIVFFATGNEYRSSLGFPASHAKVFAVGASNDQGQRCKYSNYGQGIAFVAPSSDPDNRRQGITTTDVSQRNRGFKLGSAYTDGFGGTSSATPLAAGIAALVVSLKPALRWDEVGDILKQTAAKIDLSGGKYRSGYSLQYGYGRLDAFAALQAAQGGSSKAKKKTTGKRKPAKHQAK